MIHALDTATEHARITFCHSHLHDRRWNHVMVSLSSGFVIAKMKNILHLKNIVLHNLIVVQKEQGP